MWREVEPRASRLWVNRAPTRWPAAERPYLDPAQRRIVWPVPARAANSGFAAPAASGPDIVLLPPVERVHSGAKAALLREVLATGAAAMDQRFATDLQGVAKSAIVAADLLAAQLEGDLGVLDGLPLGAVVLVALVPGGEAVKERWRVLLAQLAKRAPRAVVGIAPELSPRDRRRLVEALGEERFEEVHHAQAAGAELERDFARAVVAQGMSPILERPALALPPRAARNRAIAAALFESGERWLAVGRSEAEGASLLAAARHVESTDRDLSALARERQLGMLPFLSTLARSIVDEVVAGGRSALLAELRSEWSGGEAAA